MTLEELLKICTSEKIVVSLVGAGGKTTLMYRFATEAASQGRKVIVTTTTHIMRPESNYAVGIEDVRKLWNNGRYAVIGKRDSENDQKLVFPERELYERVKIEADLILLEADGAKGFPCKVPAEYEPVIEVCNLVIGVMGMSALGKPLKECCFRFLEEGRWLNIDGNVNLNEDIASRILASDKGTKKAVDGREYIAVLNQCDDEKIMECAKAITRMLEEKYHIKAVCCCLK